VTCGRQDERSVTPSRRGRRVFGCAETCRRGLVRGSSSQAFAAAATTVERHRARWSCLPRPTARSNGPGIISENAARRARLRWPCSTFVSTSLHAFDSRSSSRPVHDLDDVPGHPRA
jgi:hypothetical protein